MAKKSKADPILDQGQAIEIAGTTYTVRRLGLRDVFKVARILGNGIAVLGDAASYTPGQVLQILVASLSRAENEVMALIADVLNVDRKALDDPELFPMDSIIDILKALAEGQDIAAFLTKIEALMEANPEMKTASQKPSNS